MGGEARVAAGGRSVLAVDCLPLWGYTSICGRRLEMEDDVAIVPRFLTCPEFKKQLKRPLWILSLEWMTRLGARWSGEVVAKHAQVMLLWRLCQNLWHLRLWAQRRWLLTSAPHIPLYRIVEIHRQCSNVASMLLPRIVFTVATDGTIMAYGWSF